MTPYTKRDEQNALTILQMAKRYLEGGWARYRWTTAVAPECLGAGYIRPGECSVCIEGALNLAAYCGNYEKKGQPKTPFYTRKDVRLALERLALFIGKKPETQDTISYKKLGFALNQYNDHPASTKTGMVSLINRAIDSLTQEEED